jgi:Glycosyltransferase family 9 (heptosyltransferase)
MHQKLVPPPRTDADLLETFFAEFLDDQAFAEFRRIERMLTTLKEQGSTIAGYPLIRPSDCGPITDGLAEIFHTASDRFRTADPLVVDRFEALIGDFVAYVSAIYPTQSTSALILHAEVLLLMGEVDRVVELLEHLARRPYAVVDSLDHCSEIVFLYSRAQLLRGTPEQIEICFASFGAWLCGQARGPSAYAVANQIVSLASVTSGSPGLLARAIRWASSGMLRAHRGRNGVIGFIWSKMAATYFRLISTACLLILSRSQRRGAPFQPMKGNPKTTLVTRAMGGIGDLLMMEPGLEALARKQGSPVDMAIPRKFFAVFANNPLIRTLDIDGPPIDLGKYRKLANLSICPASRYESRMRPNIRKGRVETFAKEMGIGPKLLRQQGWHINQFIDNETNAKCDEFIAALGFERRLIGVQPFSRDSYKDYLHIEAAIRRLAERYDVLVFHHVADGLPEGPGIATTAGLPLAISLALVSRVEAMVSVDSAFLHAAAAYDIPVIALFGPTDARTLTRHHRNVEIIWQAQHYSCVPCWRNEDAPCNLTGQLGVSPCLATIDPARIEQAVDRAMGAA